MTIPLPPILKRRLRLEETPVGTLVEGDPTGPPLSEENVLEEGTTIIGEEGSSEVVPTNPPVAHEGIKRVKQETIEEGQASEIGPSVNSVEAAPRKSPPTVGAEEAQVKQEEEELGRSQRPPIKKRYQYQFRETM